MKYLTKIREDLKFSFKLLQLILKKFFFSQNMCFQFVILEQPEYVNARISLHFSYIIRFSCIISNRDFSFEKIIFFSFQFVENKAVPVRVHFYLLELRY